MRLIVSGPLTPALGVSRGTANWIAHLTTYIILVPAWFFFWKLLGDGWHSLILWSLRVVTACAGHRHPILRRASDGKVFEIGGRGFILGRFSTAEFEEERLPFEPGDRLILYTDGIVETRNREGEMFGEELAAQPAPFGP